VDLRNHGDSPHADTHSSPGMTADISAFMAAHSINKTSLMGHSMGGRSVMHFALTNVCICTIVANSFCFHNLAEGNYRETWKTSLMLGSHCSTEP